MLKLIGKKHTREDAIHVYQKLREAHPDIYIESTVMLGLPTEGIDDIYQLAELIGITQPDYVLCNYYVIAPRQPLAKLPQISNSCREYHLKMLIKWLINTYQRNLELDSWYIFRKPKSRKTIRLIKKHDQENIELASQGIPPKHYSQTIHYVKKIK